MPQAGTSMAGPVFSRGFSLVSLSQSCCGAGLVQASFTRWGWPETPKSRMIQALPSSLGLKAVTTTLSEDKARRGFSGVGPDAGTAMSGWEQATPNLAASSAAKRWCGRMA